MSFDQMPLKSRARELAKCIFTARKAASLTQQELSEKSFVSLGTIRIIEQGSSNSSFDNIAKLVQALGITDEEILLILRLKADK